jgi:hypothetical protein
MSVAQSSRHREMGHREHRNFIGESIHNPMGSTSLVKIDN